MRKFDARDHIPGLTDTQRARANERFEAMVCQNIDWLAYQAHRTRDQIYVDSHVGNYRRIVLSQSHEGE